MHSIYFLYAEIKLLKYLQRNNYPVSKKQQLTNLFGEDIHTVLQEHDKLGYCFMNNNGIAYNKNHSTARLIAAKRELISIISDWLIKIATLLFSIIGAYKCST